MRIQDKDNLLSSLTYHNDLIAVYLVFPERFKFVFAEDLSKLEKMKNYVKAVVYLTTSTIRLEKIGNIGALAHISF